MTKKTSSLVDIDKLSRETIISVKELKNYFVEAGAGSGKTDMLVKRMVAMVESGIDVEKICAITFTKNAALEFYERFQKSLRRRSNPNYKWADDGKLGQLPEPTLEGKRNCAKALEKIDLCFMGTIDSFCNTILSAHPFEAEIPSNSRIISESEAQKLYFQYYKTICESKDKLAKDAKIFCNMHYEPEEAFVKGVYTFLEHKNAKFEYERRTLSNFDSCFAPYKKELLELVGFLLDNETAIRFGGKTKDVVNAWNNLKTTQDILKLDWSKNFLKIARSLEDMKYLRLVSGALPKYQDELKGFYQIHDTGKKSGKWVEVKEDKIDCIISALAQYKYDFSMAFFEKCAQRIAGELKEQGLLTFSDYLYYLRETLKKDASKKEGAGKLKEYINRRYQYFLIDEFQDTNPMQAEIFFYLTAEEAKKNWKDCVPKPGSLFIVGDPKQSIYRFRNADIDSYLGIKDLFVKKFGKESILKLQRNFRSSDVLCKYFNKVLGELVKGQCAYDDIPEKPEKLGEIEGVFTYNDIVIEDGTEGKHIGDPKQIANIIKMLVKNPDYKITIDEDEEPREIDFDDIMIIVKQKWTLDSILNELKKQNIPVRVEGAVPFASNIALHEIANIYNALADKTDQLSLYATLRGKLFGFVDSDILKYRAADYRLSLTEKNIDKSTVDEVALTLIKLKEMAEKNPHMTPSTLFSFIIDNVQIYKNLDAEDLETVFYTLELLRKGETSGEIISLRDGANYLSELIAGETKEERCLSLKDRPKVHLANLHKVKGLGSPVVILAEDGKRDEQVLERFEYSKTVPSGYLFKIKNKDKFKKNAPYLENPLVNDSSSKVYKAYNEEVTASNNENIRLLYVAATRARNLLLISTGVPEKSEESAWKELFDGADLKNFDILQDRKIPVTKISVENQAEKLYSDGANSCVLNADGSDKDGKPVRTVDGESYKIARPSSYDPKVESKNKEEDATSVEEKDESFQQYVAEIVEPKVVEVEIEVSTAASQMVHKHPQEWGTMVHKLMEELVSSNGEIYNSINLKVKEIVDEYWQASMNDGNKETYSKVLLKIANAVETLSDKDEAGIIYLSMRNSTENVFCEVPFYFQEKDVVWNGIIDALYQDKEGNWHIIDYKTNANKSIEELIKEYKNQMSAYIKACKKLLGSNINVDATLFHIKENVVDHLDTDYDSETIYEDGMEEDDIKAEYEAYVQKHPEYQVVWKEVLDERELSEHDFILDLEALSLDRWEDVLDYVEKLRKDVSWMF